MARFRDHQRALVLRKQGMSYSQIKKLLGVSKSTLSLWLKDYPLSKERIKELRANNEQRIERFRETMRRKKEARLEKTYKIQKGLILPLDKKESFIAGLFLYWGEGSKSKMDRLSISNTDPNIIKFFINWLNKSLNVNRTKIRILLHLYSDMDIRKETMFWSDQLKIPLSQFNRPYVKKTLSTNVNHKGSFGHGTCNATVCSVPLAEKIFMTLKVFGARSSVVVARTL